MPHTAERTLVGRLGSGDGRSARAGNDGLARWLGGPRLCAVDLHQLARSGRPGQVVGSRETSGPQTLEQLRLARYAPKMFGQCSDVTRSMDESVDLVLSAGPR